MTIIDKSNPFPAKIKERSLLNKPGSTKQTYHIVLDIKGSGLSFNPGDSIAVIPQNDAVRVQEALRSAQCQPRRSHSRPAQQSNDDDAQLSHL